MSALEIIPAQYRPHVVIKGTDEMLGVSFLSGPAEIQPGDTTTVVVSLMYYGLVNYDGLVAGVEVELREGARTVGVGRVTRRWIRDGNHGAEG